jgi:hypothetical protein
MPEPFLGAAKSRLPLWRDENIMRRTIMKMLQGRSGPKYAHQSPHIQKNEISFCGGVLLFFGGMQPAGL